MKTIANQQDYGDKVIVSGINPSSSAGLHLGNYLGAVKQHVEMQNHVKNALYFIADYHSLNSVFDQETVRSNVLNTYMDFMAFGLKPDFKKVIFFVESGVPEITELNIILNNVVSMAELKRMHAFKDKFQKGVSEDSINHGLFNYPVLMAADILLFDADMVPVGEDQTQHVEITRDIARSLNKRYGETLKVPKLVINKAAAKVIGTDGEKKMSKSIGNDISVFATEEKIRKQILGIKTDTARIHSTDPGDPNKNVIFSYMRFLEFNQQKRESFESRYKEGTVGDLEIKEEFYKHFLEYFKESRRRREKLASDESAVRDMIKKNNEAASKIAKNTIKRVRKAVGLD